MTHEKMLGALDRFPCGCCTDDHKRKIRRRTRRREKATWKREVALAA